MRLSNITLTRRDVPHILWLIVGVIGMLLRLAIPLYLYFFSEYSVLAILLLGSNSLVYYTDRHFRGDQ
jgi:predicted membrane-bound mannosyltransferase